ncbi:MAG: endonuclease [Candidatus Cloacimonetes bacterium]|nr:endonuclease [Candidatus Cloacimonadota bacterium]
MKHKVTLPLLLLWLAVASAVAEYYDNVIDLTGEALRLALTNLISTNTNTDYNDAKAQMFGYFDNVNGYVRCVYTGQNYSVSPGGMPDQNILNTEHTYAQSWFSTTNTSIKKADLHHLFPTNAQVNSSRGNLPFDWVANHSTATTYASYNGYHSYKGMNAQNHLVFEPADQHKGNLARSLLYFNVRYGDPLTQQNVEMIPTLINWHVLDPVDNAELQRNLNIYGYQSNRNPFVDHPEFVARIWGEVSIEDLFTPPPPAVITTVYPNPFKDTTHIQISIPTRQPVSLAIYNVKGQKMRTLLEDTLAAGDYTYNFDGQDSSGTPLPSGVYFCRLSSGDQVVTHRILLLR